MAKDEELAPIPKPEKLEWFIEKARLVHGDNYDYSEFIYVNNHTKSTIICSKHGRFETNAAIHLRGSICKKCSTESRRYDTEKFIEKSKERHGDNVLDYSLLTYVNSRTPVTLICKDHGEFSVNPNQHLLKKFPCSKCADKAITKKQETFIEELKELYGDSYNFSETVYNKIGGKVKVLCKEHGLFVKRANNLLEGQGCRECSKENMSYKQHRSYIKRCELNESLRSKKGYFYILEITSEDTSEVFLKVGITINMRDRISHYNKAGLKVEKLLTLEFDSTLDSAFFETFVLNYIKTNTMRFVPSTKFSGWTECAMLQYKENLTALCLSHKEAYYG